MLKVFNNVLALDQIIIFVYSTCAGKKGREYLLRTTWCPSFAIKAAGAELIKPEAAF